MADISPVYDPLGPPPDMISSMEEYKEKHAESVKDPSAFWLSLAQQNLDWIVPPTRGLAGDFEAGDISWFNGASLNVCYNCIDRHVLNGKANDVAMIWEGDEPTDVLKLTYLDMQRRVSQIAHALESQGVRKGTVVTIYMPMIPELPMTMLACARLGAMHSVVFAGFSAEALGQRIVAGQSPVLVTAHEGMRGGKRIDLKGIVNTAREKAEVEATLEKVLVFERFYKAEQDCPYTMKDNDVRMDILVNGQRPYHAPVPMQAEEGLFLLYTR